MEEYERNGAAHWEQMMESLDLLFALITDIGRDQQQIQAQLERNAEVMAGYGTAQELLSRKVDATSQAVAQLTADFFRPGDQHPPPPPPSPRQGHHGENSQSHHPFHSGRGYQDTHVVGRNYTPKLSFPRFDGHHPKI